MGKYFSTDLLYPEHVGRSIEVSEVVALNQTCQDRRHVRPFPSNCEDKLDLLMTISVHYIGNKKFYSTHLSMILIQDCIFVYFPGSPMYNENAGVESIKRRVFSRILGHSCWTDIEMHTGRPGTTHRTTSRTTEAVNDHTHHTNRLLQST